VSAEPGIDLQAPTYTPNRLFGKVAECLGADTDADLARALNCAQAQISRMRQRKDPISYRMMVLIMDRTEWTIRKVRELAGLPAGDAKPMRKARLKITDVQVLEIRAMREPYTVIGRKYGVSDTYVKLIQCGKARRNVSGAIMGAKA
jgi:hypothetical protein